MRIYSYIDVWLHIDFFYALGWGNIAYLKRIKMFITKNRK